MSYGLNRDTVLNIVSLTKHMFYHKSTGTKSGRKPSVETKRKVVGDIEIVPNTAVVEQMQEIQKDPDLCCGYKRMSMTLILLGYYINPKKVRRLMSENQLLLPRKRLSTKDYAKYRIVTPQGPLQVIEMDIKYVWIESARQSAYVMTILDTFTRMALNWQVGFTMNSVQVKKAWTEVMRDHLEPHGMLSSKIHIEVRNDNGPQFRAAVVQQFFQDNYLNQVFTHPYTPQENGHVESFHKTLGGALGPAYWSLTDLENRLLRFYDAYNNIRVHSSIAGLPPQLFWKSWDHGFIDRKELPHKKVRFKTNCNRQDLSDIISQRETSCTNNCAQHAALNRDSGDELLQSAELLEQSVITHRRSHLAIQR